MSKEEIVISKKHIPFRITLLVIAIIVAVTSFTVLITSINKKEPGFFEIKVKTDQLVPTYSEEITLMYYADGKSNDINRLINTVKEEYASILKDSYILFDSENKYDGYINIATINDHLNEDVRVNEDLYEVLKDAYTKTLEKKNFNMFATPLHDSWNSLFYYPSYDVEQYDPLNDSSKASELSTLASKVNDLNNFTLTFDDENHFVKLNVNEDFISYLTSNELSKTYISLNNLYEAYRVDYIASKLKSKGFTNGYIFTDDGVMLSLQENLSKDYYLYDLDTNKDKIYQVGLINIEGLSSCNQFKAFSFTKEQDYKYYTISKDNKTYYRHKYIDISKGICNDIFETINVSSSNLDIVNNTYHCLNLIKLTDVNEINEYIKNLSDINVVYSLLNEEKTLYTNSIKAKLYEDSGYIITVIE